MNASDMGTTGLCEWVLAGPTLRSQGQRKRRALEVIAKRYGTARKDVFRRALAASTPNKAQREWALRCGQ